MKSLLLFLVASLFGTTLLFSQTLVSEKFADGDRFVQAPPDSLDWFANIPRMKVKNGELIMDPSDSKVARPVVAYFERTTLKEGEVLTLNFKFRANRTSGGTLGSHQSGLRFGLFDSMGKKQNRVTADEENPPVKSPGYAVSLNPLSSPANNLSSLTILRRMKKGNERGALITSSDPYDMKNPLLAPVEFPKLMERAEYRASMSLKLESEKKLLITVTLSGGNLPEERKFAAEDAKPVASFDTVSLMSVPTGFNSLSLFDIEIIKTEK